MPPAPRRIGFFITLLFVWAVALPILRADIVWDPQGGWRAEGGLISTFIDTPEGKNAKSIMDAARRAEDAGSEGSALKGYKRVIKKYPSSIFAPEALFRSARIYEDKRKFTKAFRNLQRIIAEHPSYPRFNEVLSSQYRIADKLVKGARPLYFGLIPGFKQREKGVEFYEQLVINAPYSEYAAISLMNAAAGYNEFGDRDAAIDALDRMINNYPESFLTSDAYLKLAKAQASITQGPPYDQASTQLALTYFQDYLILYPGDTEATVASEGFDASRAMLAESKMTMGDFYYYKRSNYKAAKVFYNEAITLYPDSPTAERARRLLADIAKLEAPEADGSTPGNRGPRSKRFWIF
ncbi:MAG: tetratricopeptide repeat protein [Burkholderiales bacterium]|nr:tetratricopeptide repeat protein [Opitutaceae bacterium]